MSEYELMRLQKIRRNEAKLTSLGLLAPMTSAASPSADRTNRKKRVATHVDFVRRIQPKRNVFKPTSYKDLDDPVISKRTRLSINSSDTGEDDTGSKRMDEAEYSPSGRDDEEEDDDDDEVDDIGSLSQSAEALRITAAAPVRNTSLGADYDG